MIHEHEIEGRVAEFVKQACVSLESAMLWLSECPELHTWSHQIPSVVHLWWNLPDGNVFWSQVDLGLRATQLDKASCLNLQASIHEHYARGLRAAADRLPKDPTCSPG